jgi:hypothetical protein
MITDLTTEIVQDILNKTDNIFSFHLLISTCHYFYNIAMVPNFITTKRWAKLLYSKNKNFILPRNYKIRGIYDLYPKLICNNTFYLMKMINELNIKIKKIK